MMIFFHIRMIDSFLTLKLIVRKTLDATFTPAFSFFHGPWWAGMDDFKVDRSILGRKSSMDIEDSYNFLRKSSLLGNIGFNLQRRVRMIRFRQACSEKLHAKSAI
jgi:hypothetical protein